MRMGKDANHTRYTNTQEDTDLEKWLRDNVPRNWEEVNDVRAVLYARRSVGKYKSVHVGETLRGEEKIRITGPASTALIVSNKARHYLLRRICNLVGSA